MGENAQGCGSCTRRCQKAETRIRKSTCTAGGRRYYGPPDRSIAKTGCGTGREGGYCGGNDGNTATDAGKGNTAEADDPKERKEEEEENKKEEQPARDTDGEELWPEGVSLEEMVRSQQKKKTEAAAQKPAEETSDVTEDDQNLNENRGVEEMETETETKKKDFEEVPIEDLPQKPTLAQEREEEFAFVRRKTDRSSWKGKTIHIPQVDTPVDLGKEEKQNIPLVELTDEQKAIFSYFMPVKGMEDQLCKALTVASSHLKNKETASRGNLVIKGGQGSGKTHLPPA